MIISPYAFLQHRIVEEIAAMEAYTQLLKDEAAALMEGRFSDMMEMTERKEQLVTTLVDVDQARETQLQIMGYPVSPKGANAAATAGGTSLQEAWSTLLARTAESRQHNHNNGILIHAHLELSRNAINFVHAHGQSLYGADGQHRVGLGHGKSLAAG
ncbi:flagella synthesis protein FlgN [Glaciimonas soli]|uniref:Flagellar protein FlgN n=1 Tax=Glaciimonas soli TaxID=2590999 RepID=A0A843YI77_9BURK|nr:flagellar protein FlgN [Glaciimonas soli]MQQ99468.1 flagellar protein FlgN [Glaciimonas soli]